MNGVEAGRGTGAGALGDPLVVLAWLVNHLSDRDIALGADAIVTTGTCTGLVAVGPGDLLRADFARMGSVVATLTALG